MACRCGSASLPVKHTTIGYARFSSTDCIHEQCCWPIADMTPTGSGTSAIEQGAWANIPPKRNRKEPICFSPYLYRARNLVERFFNKIKQCRRIATRYDKLAANYLAFVKLASIRLWLRVYELTA